jgi:VWFA-related protein
MFVRLAVVGRLAACVGALCLALAATGILAFTQELPQAPALPTFRASTELVQFEVIVTGERHDVVADLTVDDFVVRQDGQVVPLRAAMFIGQAPGAPRSLVPSAALARDTTSDARPPEPRDVIVVVDERNMTFDTHTRTRIALRTVVDEMLASGDRVLLVSTAPDRTVTLEFTRDRETLISQIDALTWDAIFREPVLSDPDREPSDRECTSTGLVSALTSDVMSVGSFGVLAQLLTELRPMPGRKVLLWVTDGLSKPRCIDATWALTERIRRLTDLANRSGVVVYGVQSEPWSSGVMMPESRMQTRIVSSAPPQTKAQQILDEHLRHVAERTGGRVARSNDIDAVLRDTLDDGRRYYLLTYEPPPGTFSGRFTYRRLDVTVGRPGVQVRARAGFYSVADEDLDTRR